jgi:DedD protein
MSAPEDVNVDELRRRARRRLVGAIVLALAAAVFVPMLLESEPKPLGEDVSVKIPPVDDAKFVNKLSDKGKADAPKSAPAKAAEPKPPEPRVEEKSESAKVESPAPAKAETVAEAPKTEAPKTETAKAETPKSEPPTSEARAEAPKAEAPAEPAKRSASEPDARAGNGTAAKAANPAVHENGAGFSVQLAAFSDNYGANALSNKLKKLGYPAYTEPLQTSRGTLYRVRVGPYPSREAAAASRDKLKGEGYAGIVAPSK